MSRLSRKILKIRESRMEEPGSTEEEEARIESSVATTTEWPQHETFVPDCRSIMSMEHNPYIALAKFDNIPTSDRIMARGLRDPRPEGSSSSMYPNLTETLHYNQEYNIINPNLVVGSQRVKAIKRLAAQRKRQRKLRKKGSANNQQLINPDAFISRSIQISNVCNDKELLVLKAAELRKSIRLMEVAAEQKEKEKALIIEVRDAKLKELEGIEIKLTWQADAMEDVRNNNATVSQMEPNNPPLQDVPNSSQVSVRKRGRPPLDPCYPCPSKIKPTSRTLIIDDEVSSDGVYSE